MKSFPCAMAMEERTGASPIGMVERTLNSSPAPSTTAVPLSETYNGNIANQGYVVPTSFLWDPWSDPNIVPCCYLVYVEVWDRAILNGFWSGGHYNAGWEAIEIGL